MSNRFAQICKALIEAGIGASDFASFFLPRLAPLAYDPVVNVRIAASRTIGTIYTNGKRQMMMDTLQRLIRLSLSNRTLP